MGVPKVSAEDYAISTELNRKAFETLEWLTYSVSHGRITPHQFSTGVDVLFMAVSGLIRNDFVDLVSEAQALCPTHPIELKKVFWSVSGLLRVMWTVGEDRVLMDGVERGGRYMNFDTAREARDFFNGVGEKLALKGYKEV